MASPMPTQSSTGWTNQGQVMPPSQNSGDDSGVQIRPVGLKVLYKFNHDDRFDCLARPSQTFSLQTIALDERTTIGVVDLRTCIQAVIDCSPELPGRECDFTIYAHDYSEPDTPLVGQGMLSTALQSLQQDSNAQPKMVTGLLTQNKLGLLMGNANKETLEVKIKFTETPRPQQQQPVQYHPLPQHPSQQPNQPQSQHEAYHPANKPLDRSLTPTGAAEWNSFVQANPQLGQSTHFSAAVPQPRGRPPHSRTNSFSHSPLPQLQPQPSFESHTRPGTGNLKIAPAPAESEASSRPIEANAGPVSRPSSRASNKAPPKPRGRTGRPRGRPPRNKKPVEGNTSGCEEATEGEDGPAKKRAKTTKVDMVTGNPFGSEPDSLRVAASTSGSLRNFRPIAQRGSEGPAGPSHLQEVPRAPTPVPMGPLRGGKGAKKTAPSQSAIGREASAPQLSPRGQRLRQISPGQDDGRSPDSIAETAVQTPAFSETSPPDIRSSPPVPRTQSFLQSSPPPSSPVLPPMPMEPSQNEGPGDADDVLSEHNSQPQAARQRKRKPRVPKGTLSGPRPAAQIPYQVFRMEDGPDGSQDMVHVCNYGTPEPTSAPAMPPSDALPQQALHAAKAISATRPRQIDSSKHAQAVPMAPTPPNTTDAIEKPTSPPLPIDHDQATAQPSQSEAQQPYFSPLPDAELGPSTKGVQPQVPSLLPSVEHASNETAPATDSAKATEHAVVDIDAQPMPSQETAPTSTAPKPRTKAPPKPRKLARSQSAGNLGLPNVPASEPVGPSSLSQSMTGDNDQVFSAGDPSTLRRAKSSGPTDVPVPASDPAGPTPTQAATTPSFALALPDIPPSTTDGATSSQEEKTNKNLVKKTAIKQRLEAAIRKGEMPPYCSNCGAIETPTWRKIYGQNHEGLAPYHNPEEYSSKPGMVTTVDVVRPATEGKAGLYRVIKKNLGPNDDKSAWHELLLCNPCGIWLGKTFKLRPQNRWEGDAARLGQKRKKKSSCDVLNSRPVKSRTKSDGLMMPTSEACFPTTDAIGPDDFWSPSAGMTDQMTIDPALVREPTADSMTQNFEAEATLEPQSTHSTATETAKSLTQTEAAMDAAMGTTKRLLFPSPRKDQPSTALGEVDINIVQTGSDHRLAKDSPMQKENLMVTKTPRASENFDDLEDLFRSPQPPRPTTPLNNGKAAAPTTPFKTPTRATPSHRPITRSVSRSIKSKETMLASPLLTFKRTPSRTPSKPVLDDMALLATLSKQAHEGCEGNAMDFDESIFDTPLCRAVNQMLSESNFGMHDDDGMDLIDVDMNAPDWASFNTIFSTDAPVPSSPPMKAFPGQVDLSFEAQAQMSEPWSMDQMDDAEDDA